MKTSSPIQASDPSLNLADVIHDCGMYAGVTRYARWLDSKGQWPPDIPVFEVQKYSLLLRWLRHFWLEAKANFNAVIVIDASPRIGKSACLLAIGRLLDRTFDLSKLVYDPETFLDYITDKKQPLEVIGVDEALATFLFSRNSMRGPQKGVVQNILAHLGENNKILILVAQNTRGLDWLAEDVASWFLELTQRDPITGQKYGNLRGTFKVDGPLVKAAGGWGHLPGTVRLKTRDKYPLSIPPVDAAFMAEYKAVRSAGLEAADI